MATFDLIICVVISLTSITSAINASNIIFIVCTFATWKINYLRRCNFIRLQIIMDATFLIGCLILKGHIECMLLMNNKLFQSCMIFMLFASIMNSNRFRILLDSRMEN